MGDDQHQRWKASRTGSAYEFSSSKKWAAFCRTEDTHSPSLTSIHSPSHSHIAEHALDAHVQANREAKGGEGKQGANVFPAGPLLVSQMAWQGPAWMFMLERQTPSPHTSTQWRPVSAG